MLKNDYADQECSIARSLEIVGERWTLMIVRELMSGPGRYKDLERAIGVSKNILASRLAKMQALGLIEKETISHTRDWGKYRLSRKGRDLFPVIHALMAWGDQYASPDGAPVVMIHRCGGNVGHRVVCQWCGEPVRARDLIARSNNEPASLESDEASGESPVSKDRDSN
jgi:DNA-binding HxlR family transcriptional regulator